MEKESKFLLNTLDQAPQGVYVIKLIKDEAGTPVDWVFLYCNEAMAKIGPHSKEKLEGHRFTELFPNSNLKWLDSYCKAAYENETVEFDEFSEEIGTYIRLKVMPAGVEDCCCCYISDVKSGLSLFVDSVDKKDDVRRNSALLDALCVEYLAVYLCDLKKDTIERIKLSPYSHSAAAEQEIPKEYQNSYTMHFKWLFEHIIIKESAPDYWELLKPEKLMEILRHQDSFEFQNRTIFSKAGLEYFSVKVSRLSYDEESFRVVIGIRPIGEQMQRELENQKRLENTLIELKESYRQMSDHESIISAIGTIYKEIAVIDLKNMTYELVAGPDNKYVQKGYKGTVDYLRKLLISKNISGDYRTEVEKFFDFATLAERLKDKQFINIELKAVSEKWYNCTFIVKKRDEAGNVIHVLMAAYDIDGQKKKELDGQEKLREAVAEADLANEAKSNFLRRMSHDIRTPINGIRGMIEIADYYPDDFEKQQECRTKILQATDHLLSLVNDVLDMSKLESGKFTLKHDPFDLRKILDEVNTVAAAQAEEFNIRFIHKDTKSVEHNRLIGSPVYLKRIFLNFLSNAIKYNKEDGQVMVTGQEISFDGRIAWYEFICEDTGIGMSEEFQQQAFEPFTQEEKDSARTKYAGTGLGLAITKQLIDLMGGEVELHSTEGEGTKIIFRLPFEVDFESHEKNTVDYSGLRFDGVRALLVEDNELNAEIAVFMLRKHGLEVTWATNGRQAVELFAEAPDAYDIIFMDVMMPILGGLDATREIRKMDAGKTIPIAAMTANAFTDDVQRSLDAGMNIHLMKPLQEKEIVKAICKYIKRQ